MSLRRALEAEENESSMFFDRQQAHLEQGGGYVPLLGIVERTFATRFLPFRQLFLEPCQEAHRVLVLELRYVALVVRIRHEQLQPRMFEDMVATCWVCYSS